MAPKRRGALPAAVAAAAADVVSSGGPSSSVIRDDEEEAPKTPHGKAATPRKAAASSPRKRGRARKEEIDEYEEDDFVVADDADEQDDAPHRKPRKSPKKKAKKQQPAETDDADAAAAEAEEHHGGEEEDEKPDVMIEYSKSGTASCRHCNEKIHKNAIRVGVLGKSFRGGQDIYRYFHSHCPGWTSKKEAGDDPSAIPGFETLSAEDQEAVREHFAASKQHGHGHVGTHAGEDWPLPPSVPVTPELSERVQALTGKYDAMHKQQLHDVLMANAMFVTGSKSELVGRCVEGEALGAMPFPCPLCKFGRVGRATPGLAATMGPFEYTCRGWWEKESAAASYHPCAYAVNSESLPRTPFVQPGDPGDRTEEVQNFSETKKRMRDEAVSAIVHSAPAGWADSLAPLPIKEAAVKLAEFASGKGLSIPEAARTLEAGKALLHTKKEDGHLDPSAALEYLAKHHLIHGGGQHPSNTGVAAGGAAAAGGGGGGGGGQPGVVALVAENEPIAEKLERHADTEDDFFKRNAYRKAIPAVRNCKFRITSGDAVSKGKNKIPGIGKGIGHVIDAFLIRHHDQERAKEGGSGGGGGGGGAGEEGEAAAAGAGGAAGE